MRYLTFGADDTRPHQITLIGHDNDRSGRLVLFPQLIKDVNGVIKRGSACDGVDHHIAVTAFHHEFFIALQRQNVLRNANNSINTLLFCNYS